MFGSAQRKLKVLFGLSDVCLTAIAFAIAYTLRQRAQLDHEFFLTPDRMALVLGFSCATSVVTGFWMNVYGKLDSAKIRIILTDSFRQSVYGALALVVLVYALRFETSRVFLFSFVFLSWLLLVCFRITARNLIPVVRRQFGVLRYVLVVGLGDRARHLAQTLESYYDNGLRIVGFLACPEDGPAPDTFRIEREYPVFPIASLQSMIRKHVIDEVHFAVESDRLPSLEDVFLSCDDEGVTSRIAVDFFPHVNSQIALERIGPMPLLTFSAAPDDEVLLLVKRVTDMALASVALLVLSPVFLLVAVLVKLTSPGPVIFKQIRCGLNGRNFTFYKFRSMVVDAEERMDEVAHLNPKDVVTKIPNDPRLTPVGRFLRRFSLDELPQLFNVLRGDMSLVGPRPAIPSEVDRYKRWQRRRLRMRPGLTCLWAVNGRDAVDFETWMRLDMAYIDNWSLTLDARIILQTIPHVITGKGAS
ncbi:MAG TPA: sugar transferase [Bryobacteraceae bacterium]|jgi:exopolysaccharide biosynthesis polyprenyl glycosylphosphotransferase|nr:sugar transferase [Bryobacteraceae bacterium]